MILTRSIESPLGVIRIYGTRDALTGVYLPDQPAPDAPAGDTPALAATAAQLAEYFAGARTTFDLPLAASGTAFQQRVWQALATIPYAETWSYGVLAQAIDRPAASRAVGAANGKNPISIIVPCHRVVGASGALTGYAGGVPAKRWLLAHERRHAPARALVLASC